MIQLKKFELWFVTGSQFLYGDEALRQVSDDSRIIADFLNASPSIPVSVVWKPTVKTADEIYQVAKDANAADDCIGVIAWMHTFSPAKMWIRGLKALSKPMLQFHTQFNQDIPWDTMDMDFMNLNQSAHGDREFGFMVSRLGIRRKVLAGYWKDPAVLQDISNWARVAAGWHDLQGAKFARFGDNMRDVAVTEGDKVEAQIKFGYSVDAYGLGDLKSYIDKVKAEEIDALCEDYEASYDVAPSLAKGAADYDSLREAARIEAGLRNFLEDGHFKGFIDNFENLHGLVQLPGIAAQRLMAEGYGFGAEGDWKTAALVRAMKVMGAGLDGGNSFIEDYTYHFNPSLPMELGSHMLEVCPSIAAKKPSCEIHPLGIGGKADPVRLVFDVEAGAATQTCIVDMGDRFRVIVNDLEVQSPHSLPKLPVARALWKPLPDLKIGSEAWIYAGGAHHSCFSQNITSEQIADFAEIAGVECIHIGKETTIAQIRNELRWNEAYYRK